MSTLTPRLIFTDGAAPNNQNGCKHGGLGVVVLNDQEEVLETYKARVEPVEGKETTTNVRCEMLAVIKALELAESEDIIHTDNDMIAKGYNEWLKGWKLKGWKNANKKPVANQDLWQRIDKLKQEKPKVVVKWVRGHSGIYGNELADNLATEAAA
ncbi:ribonuclease H [Alteromonas sp. KC3]|uniref:RNase H family protein n=1 Tax=unclassified Alteromonas TaxID=2614992 RepID=UPI0019236E46|nr:MULTISPECIES: RNase H family protein [unclassified Alteromonas]BCO20928.1 ribonuclease H [Alteromonas sp. KC3]BCO24898.1 ribonuclease H [Alteromonas sp. KC14]